MSNDREQLERLIGRTLRELPPRRAPASLESRVLAAVESRSAASPWKRGFVHWPLVARAAFILASFGFVKLALLAAGWTAGALSAPAWTGAAAAELSAIKAVANGVFASVQSIPESWLWLGFGLFAALYAMVFALSAIAYRTLYAAR